MGKIKVIFWDFDGVLMNSNAVRDLGFERVLSEFPKDQVQKLLDFHKANGGLSRYVKFRYFFEDIRGESISDTQIALWAEKFSVIMKQLLLNPELLITETVNFVKQNHQNFEMYITSGSDQEELRFLCEKLNIFPYFKSIHGSPKPKKEWVKELIQTQHYNPKECALIGDSRNDWEAAEYNGIFFKGYNDESVEKLTNIEFNIA